MTPERQFAVEVVQQLRTAGYEALWAGGCVRDELLGRTPKDYDVATSAPPDEIRQVFGRRRTLAIGAAFGVITVLGRKEQGQIEVATFRQDAAYSDGRHPDSVHYSTPENDAARRDFTINGLFFDPLESRVIDYVGGQADLAAGVIRAIGDADARIDEDKLRMLRAVRFAATYTFDIEPKSRQAVQRHAEELRLVSAERIAEEMRRMLRHEHRARAVELLHQTRLLNVVLPELEALAQDDAAWSQALQTLFHLGEAGTFASALAILLRAAAIEPASGEQLVNPLAQRWRLSNSEKDRTTFLLRNEPMICRARETPWPQLQRVLTSEGVEELLDYCAAIVQVEPDNGDVDFCRRKLALPPEELDPPPLLNGLDLKAAGIPPGQVYQKLLQAVRDAQLEGQIRSAEEARAMAVKLWQASDDADGHT